MSDLIDRKELCHRCQLGLEGIGAYCDGYCVVSKAKAVDAAPVVHGERTAAAEILDLMKKNYRLDNYTAFCKVAHETYYFALACLDYKTVNRVVGIAKGLKKKHG